TEVRAVYGHVRRNARSIEPLVLRFSAGVRAAECICRRAWNRRNADEVGLQRMGRLSCRVPGRQGIDRCRQAVEIPAEQTGALAVDRIRGRPDLSALEMRAARILVAGS